MKNLSDIADSGCPRKTIGETESALSAINGDAQLGTLQGWLLVDQDPPYQGTALMS